MPAHLFDGLDDVGLLTKQRIQQLAKAYGMQRMLRSPKGNRGRHQAARENEREQASNRQAWRREAQEKRYGQWAA
ncbi:MULTISPECIES: hypothetical protein [Burkholderiaceae]|uniref:hypothetical protein n=1 Tax=Burkholderiaceae TaxID=119060 RepID=UPI0002A3F858|nr:MULTISPECIES: hypothetical protein [Burkholderiaceae]ELA01435.1 hypothetical protein D769_00205 [Cupriavidus sp. HMR-1]KVS16493.1 hypothetical protein WK32_27405 [Burkholderia vietnamiensis]MDR8057630.1 hypothetical protein [Burkholderia cenocepacia]MDR8062278.1 hypothetical protein [Burkholderia cenocepacia]